ncbi:lipid-A-disaccharide synthase [Hydrogenivirga sp. 128-5-R1-1]|uniref:lipid-A-disaccharide synthase n=1 Tax=Hydrogenivirga sp. 128-5-R1-1 TaxID=392423 RepID=UPI00031E1982|nr:lipid-A-disaccharide synthase [Hydrogenivirga sp. 128-5-R1-1]
MVFNNSMHRRVFLSIGDVSAANYIYEIFREGFEDTELVGITNEKLESIGVKSVASISELSVVGIAEVLPKLLQIRRIYKRCLETLSGCDILVACDAPGFNLRLIKEARNSGVKKIIYFISPQVWAWKPRRAEVIARYADELVLILPFERELYSRFENKHFRVHYVGHPLVDMVRPGIDREEFLEALGTKGVPVNLMPGSRWGEVKRHAPFLKEVVKGLVDRTELFVLPTFEEFRLFLEDIFKDLPVRVITERDISSPAYSSMFYSKLSLIASGTSSLEAALALNPHVVFYRVNLLTYLIGKLLVKVEHVSLPNLILGREVVPELINRDPFEVVQVARELLEDEEKREAMKESFGELKRRLGGEGVILKLRSLFKELLNG